MQSGYTAAAAFVQPTRRRSRPATLQRARTTLRPAGVTSMCQVMRSAGRAGTVTGTGACFSIGSPYPDGCEWRRSRRFSGCVSPSPSGVDRSADGPGDGPVVRLDDSEFRRNGNVRTEATAATGSVTVVPSVPDRVPVPTSDPPVPRGGPTWRDSRQATATVWGYSVGWRCGGGSGPCGSRAPYSACSSRPWPSTPAGRRRRGARRGSVGRAAARQCPRGRCSSTYVLLPTPSRLRGGIGRPNT
jgi:hypothetical protein